MDSTLLCTVTGRADSNVPPGMTATVGFDFCEGGAGLGVGAAQPVNKPAMTTDSTHIFALKIGFLICIRKVGQQKKSAISDIMAR